MMCLVVQVVHKMCVALCVLSIAEIPYSRGLVWGVGEKRTNVKPFHGRGTAPCGVVQVSGFMPSVVPSVRGSQRILHIPHPTSPIFLHPTLHISMP